MTGFNLPPGCSVSDIPGNRPEDAVIEALTDTFYEFEQKARDQHPDCGDAYVEALSIWFLVKMSEAWKDGYKLGQADEAMARDEVLHHEDPEEK